MILPSFEMVLREGGARSVMAAYNDIDGLPAHAHTGLLTQLLRDTWKFNGTLVSGYFGIAFLESAHRVAASDAEAGRIALAAGEGEGGGGELPEEHLDRAALRVLTQKCELELLDPDDGPESSAGPVDLNPPHMRELAAKAAQESVVLLANDAGLLPLPDAHGLRIALSRLLRRRCERSCRAPSSWPTPRADVCLAVVGDHSGPFGRGSSGEGCDAEGL
ncbi:glycoside hydrolase family 3 N-terminal domain-containing protein [Streptomyces sp. NPDC002790]|uniref:glycoside hydrolase family 3 N-terminal domain-containing protein n=1 Tax=Streptomyces sp. NPDC002790 TaxID=3154431 RepID=UPI00331B595E